MKSCKSNKVKQLSISLIHNTFIYFCVFPADDFADEEEVQSFGYKRFGKYQVTF